MLSDLVIDTNVLLHACNPNDLNFGSAKDFLEILLDVPTILRVENGFSPDRARNRSYIMGEYLDNLRAGSFGLAVILSLAKNERIKGVKRIVGQRESKKIRQAVMDRSDRIFVKVALNSEEQVLVSHDFEHFTIPVRSSLRKDIGVSIVDCEICCPRLYE